MIKRIREFEKLPLGYGVIYYDFPRLERVCTFIGLNLVFRWLRELYYFIAMPKLNRFEKAVMEVKSQYQVDYRKNEKRIQKEIDRRIAHAMKVCGISE